MQMNSLHFISMPVEAQEAVAKLMGFKDLQVVQGALWGRLDGHAVAAPTQFDYDLLAKAEQYLEWQQRLFYLGRLIETAGTASLWAIRNPDLDAALAALLEAAKLPVGD